ncbi:TPA: hypothetical protein JRX92_002814 [Elizabethkingia anophelis]|nr:hypothetical protein [Elizabethkingia anophelis]
MEKIVKSHSDTDSLSNFKAKRIYEETGKPMPTVYNDLTNPDKNEYKKDLLKEQYYLCAYCNKLLDDDEESLHKLKIEHWYPQTLCKAEPNYNTVDGLDLAHQNLLIVCNGENVNPNYNHCDSSRTPGKVLTIKPHSQEYETFNNIIYEGSKIDCINADIKDDIEKELNLNHDDLIQKRRIVLDQFRKQIMNLGKQTINKQSLITKYSTPNREGKKRQYCTIIIHEINKL